MIMTRTQWTELFRSIRNTLVSFCAIILFVALATGLFTGIRWTSAALKKSVDSDYEKGRFHHFEIRYPYGFDDGFIQSLVDDGIADEAEGVYETFRYIKLNNDRVQIKISSVTDVTDRLIIVDGTLPQKDGEIAVSNRWATQIGIRIGDTIIIEKSTDTSMRIIRAVVNESLSDLISLEDSRDELKTNSFSVTALVESSEYMGKYPDTNGISYISSAPVDTVMFVPDCAFDPDVCPGYQKIVIRTSVLDGLQTFSDEYRQKSDEYIEVISDFVKEYTESRNESLLKSVDNMKSELDVICEVNSGVLSSSKEIREILEGVKGYEPVIMTRFMNGSLAGLNSVMDSFDKMQYSFVAIFVAVGILVCYSAVSRIVYEQAVFIGTEKAIGFSSRQIILPFLLYSAFACVTGLLTGIIISRFLIESVLIESVRDTYYLGQILYSSDIKDTIVFSVVQLVFILVTAFTACFNVLRQPALALLAGQQRNGVPDRHRIEQSHIWNRLSLLQKTVVKNIINDPRRVLATLIGVAGCTALVISYLSCYRNLVDSFDINMNKITRYDTIIHFSGSGSSAESISDLMDENKIPNASVYYSHGAIQLNNDTRYVCGLFATDDPEFNELFHIYDISNGKESSIEKNAWVNVTYAENFGASVGDKIRFIDSEGQTHEFVIEGFFEYYLMNYQIIIPRTLYEEEFGKALCPNSFLVRAYGYDFESLISTLLSLDDCLLIEDFFGGNKGLFDSITMIAFAMLGICLALSVVLAFFLLLNLFIMFVREKKKELIILMINGFIRKTVNGYVYTDTFSLTVIGLLIGVIAGIIMGRYSLDTYNNCMTYFINRISVISCILGVLFTSLLSFIMCHIALNKVKEFSLSEINET